MVLISNTNVNIRLNSTCRDFKGTSCVVNLIYLQEFLDASFYILTVKFDFNMSFIVKCIFTGFLSQKRSTML